MDPQITKNKQDKIGAVLILIIIGSIFISNFLITTPLDSFYADYIIVVVVYTFLAVLIWIEKNNLIDFHLDRWTLLTIILTGTIIHRRLGLRGEIGFQISLWIFSISIFAFLIINRSKIPRTNSIWALSGFVVGLLSLFPIVLIETFNPELSLAKPINPSNNIILEVIRRAIYDLSYVAPIEETLFRGLLWGYLVRVGWKEDKVFWFQAVLFWISHISRIEYPVSFFITIPISTIVFSMLVRYSKQLFPSIIAHTVLNTLVPIVLFLLVRRFG